MEKSVLVATIIVSFLFSTPIVAFANTSVEISNNGEGAKTSVRINSNTSTTNTEQSSKTEVRINNNGEVKEIITNSNEPINYQSPDGSTSVQIDNQASISSQEAREQAEKKLDEAKKKIKEKRQEIEKKREELKDKAGDGSFNLQAFLEEQLEFLKSFFDTNFFNK